MDLRETGLNRLPSKFERRVLAAGLALSLGVSALAGCSSGDADAEPKPGKTYEAVSVPNPEPTETESGSSAEETGTPSPSETSESETPSTENSELLKLLDSYENMTAAEFETLNWDEQVKYWPVVAASIKDFANEYASNLPNPGSNPNAGYPSEPASVENSAQIARNYSALSTRYIFSIEDQDEALKALYITSPNRDDGSYGQKRFEELEQDLKKTHSEGNGYIKPWMMGTMNVLPTGEVTQDLGVQKSPDGHDEMHFNITIVKEDGTTASFTDAVTTLGHYVNPVTGKKESWWF